MFVSVRVVLFCLAFVSATFASETKINPAATQRTWDGWGTSLAWLGKAFGDRDDVADLLFSRDEVRLEGQIVPGLGLNIARYNAGACSESEVNGKRIALSSNAPACRMMEGFWLDGKNPDPKSRSWNWSVDKSQRALLLKARQRGADRFELFSNSPMWWMCKNLNPSRAGEPTEDNLAPEHYRDFAVYLSAIARHARDGWGITFNSVEPFNEPISSWWHANGNQEGCRVSVRTQPLLLKVLRKEMDQRGLQAVGIAASDENTCDQALRTWNHMCDAKNIVARVNVHGYGGVRGRRDLLREAAKQDRKALWNSEYGDADPTGLEMARCIHLDFRELHPSAWCYWQPLDNDGWGLIGADLAHKLIRKVNPKYFVLAQYTRHVHPGMMILDTGDGDVVTAYDVTAGKLVLVALNSAKTEIKKVFDLSAFSTVDGPVAAWRTEPNGTALYQLSLGGTMANKRLECVLPAQSIETFEIANVKDARP
jgi:galactan endo-1,6-beta-galactosidase